MASLSPGSSCTRMKPLLGLRTSTHGGGFVAQFRRKRMPEFRQHGGRNQNSRVEMFEEADLSDEDEEVDRRRVCDDNYRARAQC